MTTINYQKEYELFSKIQSNNEDPRYYMDELYFPGKYDRWDNTVASPRKRYSKCKFVGVDKDKLRLKALRASRKSTRMNNTKHITDLFNNKYENYQNIRWNKSQESQ